MISPLERVLHSIATSRVVLHIRRVAGNVVEELTTEEAGIQLASNVLRSDTGLENQGNRELEGMLSDRDGETGHR
ncbi:hypothetical protein E1B28_000047 [Marasmius oreades]|uniref:Uncharacterized protein n=1 Tax=Marasmius oreades TaxID=181124 RepID=A0A9P7V0L2_9AGAR|nr:uncharacterized protein E1B28_000047 [Marasmius oreades]KAG7098073.1 hypothetical protein E1B28_000047 [Marasmius oreades]